MEPVVIERAVELLTLTEVKDQQKIYIADDDDLLAGWIVAAREWAETVTRRTLPVTSYRLHLDSFPNQHDRHERYRHERYYEVNGCPDHGIIELPKPPLISVESVTYLDENGNTQTLGTDKYIVDADSTPGRIALPF